MSALRDVGWSRWWRLLLIVAGLALVAASCSGETSDGDSATSTDNGGDDGGASDDSEESDDDAEEAGEPSDDDAGGEEAGGEEAGEADDSAEGGDNAGSTENAGGTDSGEGPFADPRGGIFAEFQDQFDRGHPFQTLDTFCIAHEEAEDRIDTDPGITADAIEVTHMKSRLEDLIDIGFGVDVGDTNDMFERFVNFINTECGGIRGRQLDLGQSEWSPLEGDAAVLAACVEATEDRNTVVAMNSSGMQGPGVLCMTEENETNLITTQGLSEEFLNVRRVAW